MVTATNEQRKELRQRTGVGEFGKAAAGAAAVSPFEPGYQGHKQYALALAWMDRGVGTVLWALQRKGVAHATLIVFASDHAATDKGHCYTRGTAVPLIMQWPDALPQKARVGALVSLVDIVPTLLHAANLPRRASRAPRRPRQQLRPPRPLAPPAPRRSRRSAASRRSTPSSSAKLASRARLTPTHHYLLAPHPKRRVPQAAAARRTARAAPPRLLLGGAALRPQGRPRREERPRRQTNAAAAGGATPTDPAWVVLGNLRSRLRGLLSNASARCFADGPW